ncbi:hypothetical protein BDB00DRAFT_788499 [Zychaea mexicana]|uniref:uncharacterized protein n=1 Tax=Zychaea mexicana TaxID=64656 RepID=UPI0022FEA7B9|nr:uncharacterized protein BDB00DRAFT_788499 [Zychaea mexicana]KAI9492673.1 hypothetical protein BDB00DRAFT_788499 [Zychaea mexicana]
MRKKKKKERRHTATSIISHQTSATAPPAVATTGGINTAATTTTAKDDVSPFARAYDHDLATKFSDSVVNDLELLLSMETQARMDALEARQRQEEEAAATNAVKSRRLTFELPARPDTKTPPNTSNTTNSSNINNNSNNKLSLLPSKNRRGSLGSIYSSEDDGDEGYDNDSMCESGPTNDDDDFIPPPVHMNARVRLIRRPLPTYGSVRFIGQVDFAPGQEWIGVELDSRVGKNDGSVKGKRYFTTDRDRGIFVLRENLSVVV